MPLRPLVTTTGCALPLQPLRSLLRAERRAIHFGLQPPFLSRAREEMSFVRADLVSRDPFKHLDNFFWSETLNNVEPAA